MYLWRITTWGKFLKIQLRTRTCFVQFSAQATDWRFTTRATILRFFDIFFIIYRIRSFMRFSCALISYASQNTNFNVTCISLLHTLFIIYVRNSTGIAVASLQYYCIRTEWNKKRQFNIVLTKSNRGIITIFHRYYRTTSIRSSCQATKRWRCHRTAAK